MKRFIQTRGLKWIAISRIGEIEWRSKKGADGEDEQCGVLFDRAGRQIGTIEPYVFEEFEKDNDTEAIVPNHDPKTLLLEFWLEEVDGGINDELHVVRYPIVAWRVMGDEAYPVSLQERSCSNCVYLVEREDTRGERTWTFLGGDQQTVSELEDDDEAWDKVIRIAKEMILERLKEEEAEE